MNDLKFSLTNRCLRISGHDLVQFKTTKERNPNVKKENKSTKRLYDAYCTTTM